MVRASLFSAHSDLIRKCYLTEYVKRYREVTKIPDTDKKNEITFISNTHLRLLPLRKNAVFVW
jgi:hypothetical protein